MDLRKLSGQREFGAYQEECKKRLAMQKRKIYVCCGSVCLTEGAMKIYASLKETLEAQGISCAVELGDHLEDGGVNIKKTGCHGFCNYGPMLRIDPEGWLYTKVQIKDVEEIVQKSIVEGKYISRLGFDDGIAITKREQDITFFRNQTRRVLKNCGKIDAENVEDYIAQDGYSALIKVLFEMNEDQVLEEIRASGLRGRGGIGANAYEKWHGVAVSTQENKILLVNDGKSAVGSYMDRGIVEGDPHKLVEGMTIIGIACGIMEGYVYIHPQYQAAVYRLKKAVDQAEALGLLGDNIMNSGKSFHLHVNSGLDDITQDESMKQSSEYIQNPKKKWFSQNYMDKNGKYQPATVSNNVETVVNVPDIILNGADWFRFCGTEESTGTKVFMLTGAVNNTGMIEIPFGMTVREVVEKIGGGMAGAAPFRAMRLGGSVMLMRDNLDMPIAFENLEELGDNMGTGGLEVMDNRNSIMETAKYLLRFAARGSCGKCTPCREGLPRMTFLLEKLSRGEGTREDMAEVTELAYLIQTSALCFETCAGLGVYEIDEAACIGCTKCARNCPVSAITGSIKKPHVIDQAKCIKCGACFRGCPKHAVKENNPWLTNT